jgi:hypothetical protein
MKNQGLGIVKGLTPSETVEEPIHVFGIREAGNVGVLSNQDSFAPTIGKRKKSG